MEKTKTMFFTRKKIDEEIKVRLYDKNVERVKSFKFLRVFFDERITWRVHITKVLDKCKKVLNTGLIYWDRGKTIQLEWRLKQAGRGG